MLHRRPAALCLRDHLHDLRKHGLRANFVGAHRQTACAVDRRTDDACARYFFNRHRLAREHGFVDARPPLRHDTVDGHLLAGTHAQDVPDVDVRKWNVMLGSVRQDASRRLSLQPEQRTNGGGRLRASAKLQYLPKQRERHDHRSCLEVHRDAARFPEVFGEHTGNDRGQYAVDESSGDANADQCPHVGAGVANGRDATHEERPACPQHDRCGEQQLEPRHGARRERHEPMAAHCQNDADNRQRQRRPEASREISEFGILLFFQRRHFRLECHAANRAVARRGAADLRMHRTDVVGSRRRFDRRVQFRGGAFCIVPRVRVRDPARAKRAVMPVLTGFVHPPSLRIHPRLCVAAGTPNSRAASPSIYPTHPCARRDVPDNRYIGKPLLRPRLFRPR